MIHVLASIQIKEGYISEFIEIFKANIPNVLEEKGCIEYAPTIDVPTGFAPQELNANRVTIIEKWASLEDLKAHLSTPHMLSYREATKHLVTDLSIKVLKQV
ncbi:putative quinol monooxygenase [Desulforhopalus singaporensis]|uniref:Quinol monooxygenase YgiN n=1 Tax=Desulforhopalus singaporensis TaxID=91360 RepID=A0A1H0UVA6_9BACT|nr:putative quinol monooxygenase [Desulforhopalus singaporensis]SDP70110.1 Quinol monooxygenase YgiN [Desulforhopalus singaporensis]